MCEYEESMAPPKSNAIMNPKRSSYCLTCSLVASKIETKVPG
jgi:hypothetical protein